MLIKCILIRMPWVVFYLDLHHLICLASQFPRPACCMRFTASLASGQLLQQDPADQADPEVQLKVQQQRHQARLEIKKEEALNTMQVQQLIDETRLVLLAQLLQNLTGKKKFRDTIIMYKAQKVHYSIIISMCKSGQKFRPGEHFHQFCH